MINTKTHSMGRKWAKVQFKWRLNSEFSVYEKAKDPGLSLYLPIVIRWMHSFFKGIFTK